MIPCFALATSLFLTIGQSARPHPGLIPTSAVDTADTISASARTTPLTMDLAREVDTIAQKLKQQFPPPKIREIATSHHIDMTPTTTAAGLEKSMSKLITLMELPEFQPVFAGSKFTPKQFCWTSLRLAVPSALLTNKGALQTMISVGIISQADIDFAATHASELKDIMANLSSTD